MELAYAQQNHLPTAGIENQDGQCVQPSPAGTTADVAAFSARLARTALAYRESASQRAGRLPDSGLTFLIIPKDGPDKAKRTALKQFVQYIITDGQAAAETLDSLRCRTA